MPCGGAPCPHEASTSWRSGWGGSPMRWTRSWTRWPPAGRCSRPSVASGGAARRSPLRWIAERARRKGFATSELQISETETPLHHLQTVYRRVIERLSVGDGDTGSAPLGGRRMVLRPRGGRPRRRAPSTSTTRAGLIGRTDALMEQRLGDVSPDGARRSGPSLRAYRAATHAGDHATADGLLAWLGGQPNVGRLGEAMPRGSRARSTTLGALVPSGAAAHPARLAAMPGCSSRSTRSRRSSGSAPTLATSRLNALRQMLDEIDGGRFPGLYLLITGTPAFFDGPQGVQRLDPLAQRLATDFTTDARFDNPRAVQIRLTGFDHDGWSSSAARSATSTPRTGPRRADPSDAVDDAYVGTLATAVTGNLGGKVGVAPRIFLKKLVGDVLDRVDQFDDFDPRVDYQLTVGVEELTDEERNASARPHRRRHRA